MIVKLVVPFSNLKIKKKNEKHACHIIFWNAWPGIQYNFSCSIKTDHILKKHNPQADTFLIVVPCCLWQCGCRTIGDVHCTGPPPTGNQGARHVGHLFHRPRPEEGEGVDGADRGWSSIPVFCTSYICDSCGQTLCRCFVCMCVKLEYDKIVSYLKWKFF